MASIPGAEALAAQSKRCPKSRRCDGRCCPSHSHCRHGKCRCNSGYTRCGKKCCPTATCGNETIDPGETCDGSNLGGQTCQGLGFAGGTLACSPDCTGYDTSGCVDCISPSDCSDPHAVCTDGTCGCAQGYYDCAGNGVCNDLSHDTGNCGSCGHVCALPHATNGCRPSVPSGQGECYVVACDPGYCYIAGAGPQNGAGGMGCFYEINGDRCPTALCSTAGTCTNNPDGHACVDGHCGCNTADDCPMGQTCGSGNLCTIS
jgi:hypothetical protein